MRREGSPARSFVLLLGVVSLLGDMTYEGGWSIVGPYMATLGASAAIVGIASGFGELVGYVVRLGSGITVDRTRGYWPVAIFGYVVNVLSVPALASLAVLGLARRRFPHPERTGAEQRGAVTDRRGFILYTLFASLTVAGFAHFSIISYHITVQRILSEPLVPLFFAIATGVSAVAALVAGLAFDRVGLASVLFVPIVTAVVPFLVFGDSPVGLAVGMVLWGVVLGAQESTVRAAVAHLVAPGARATAYGIFNTAYGVAWFLGSAALGVAYDRSIPAVIAISVSTQVLALAAAVPVFASRRRAGPRR